MKPWIFLLIAGLVIVLIAGGVLGWQWVAMKHQIMDGDGMVREPDYVRASYPPSEGTLLGCSYSRTGGMENERYCLTLIRTESGTELTYEYRDRETGEERTEVFSLQAEAMDALQQIYRDRGIGHWPPLEREEWELLDAPSVGVTFATADGQTGISDEQILPDQGGRLISDVREALEALVPQTERNP